MKIAGPILEIFFSGTKISSSSFASIATDAWVFVGNREEFDLREIVDERFFVYREKAILGFFRLTGYDVEMVSIHSSGVLEMKIGDKDVIIYPIKTDLPYVHDFWDIFVEGQKGQYRYQGFLEGTGFLEGRSNNDG
jgi:hypothetical protein